jgi:hypothetical protein
LLLGKLKDLIMAISIFGSYGVGAVDLGFDTSDLIIATVDGLPAKIQSIHVEKSERVQPINCFNDYVHLYTFGKNVCMISISGFCLANKLRYLIAKYESTYRAYTQKLIRIVSTKGEILEGVVTSFSYDTNADSNSIANFSFTIMKTDTTPAK